MTDKLSEKSIKPTIYTFPSLEKEGRYYSLDGSRLVQHDRYEIAVHPDSDIWSLPDLSNLEKWFAYYQWESNNKHNKLQALQTKLKEQDFLLANIPEKGKELFKENERLKEAFLMWYDEDADRGQYGRIYKDLYQELNDK